MLQRLKAGHVFTRHCIYFKIKTQNSSDKLQPTEKTNLHHITEKSMGTAITDQPQSLIND